MPIVVRRRSLIPRSPTFGIPQGLGNRRMAMHKLSYGKERISDPGPEIPLTQDPEASKALTFI